MPSETLRNRGAAIAGFLVIVALLMIPSALFVTSQSVWGDEASSAWFADHSRGFNPAEYHFLAAVPQMPLYHLLLVPWVHLFGDSEQALRSINLPFAALFLGSLVLLCLRPGSRWSWLPVVPFAVFPLLTYYVNECRPYVALLALSTAACVSLLAFLRSDSRMAAYLCCFFCLAAFGLHLLGILTPFILLTYIFLRRDTRVRILDGWKRWIVPFALSLPGYLALLYYYAHAKGEGIPHGQKALNPDTPGNVASSWKNVVFFFYETLGFSGLGPPRNDLRVHANWHLFIGYAGWMLLGGLALLSLVLLFDMSWKSPRAKESQHVLLAASLAGLAVLFAVARAIHFGFFGRHAMAIVGMICCALVMALRSERVSYRARAAVIAILTLAWGISSARVLFDYPYGKDDVRTALTVAKSTGLPILWDAAPEDAAYYGAYDLENMRSEELSSPTAYPAGHWRETTALKMVFGTTQADVDRVMRPFSSGRYVFVTGKADVSDPAGVWHENLAAWHPILLSRLNGFEVWIITFPAEAHP